MQVWKHCELVLEWQSTLLVKIVPPPPLQMLFSLQLCVLVSNRYPDFSESRGASEQNGAREFSGPGQRENQRLRAFLSVCGGM